MRNSAIAVILAALLALPAHAQPKTTPAPATTAQAGAEPIPVPEKAPRGSSVSPAVGVGSGVFGAVIVVGVVMMALAFASLADAGN